LTLVLAAAAAAQDDSVSVPGVVGLDVYAASKLLTRAGLEPVFTAVLVESLGHDTSSADGNGSCPAPEFFVKAQTPDSGKMVVSGASVAVQFTTMHELRYWDNWVVPLLGDFKHQVSLFKATRTPEVISMQSPGYPDELLKYKYSGVVGVEVFIDFDASPLAARIVQSTGYPEADSSALVAAMQGMFSPAEYNGQPVRVWVPASLAFQYQDMEGVPGIRDIEKPSGGE